jgi:hypothetical protein
MSKQAAEIYSILFILLLLFIYWGIKTYFKQRTMFGANPKNFLIENVNSVEKVRKCTSNVAKMNIFEFMYYLDQWDLVKQLRGGYIIGLKGLGTLIMTIVVTVLFPIFMVLRAIFTIRDAKKQVRKHRGVK